MKNLTKPWRSVGPLAFVAEMLLRTQRSKGISKEY